MRFSRVWLSWFGSGPIWTFTVQGFGFAALCWDLPRHLSSSPNYVSFSASTVASSMGALIKRILERDPNLENYPYGTSRKPPRFWDQSLRPVTVFQRSRPTLQDGDCTIVSHGGECKCAAPAHIMNNETI